MSARESAPAGGCSGKRIRSAAPAQRAAQRWGAAAGGNAPGDEIARGRRMQWETNQERGARAAGGAALGGSRGGANGHRNHA